MDNIIKNQYYYNQLQKKIYYIVKIAGKGNINVKTPEYKKLKKNINHATKTIIYNITKYNKKNKEVLIIWDGDNYQDDKGKKDPSPFTEIIKLLKLQKPVYKFMALKKNKNSWKNKHVKTWKPLKFKKYYTLNKEPHIITNNLCNMYISYGSKLFKYKNNTKELTSGYKQLYTNKGFIKKYKTKKIYSNNSLGFDIFLKTNSNKNKTIKNLKNNKKTKKLNIK